MDVTLTLITGGSRGLGLAIAEQSAEAGHQVVSIARRHAESLPTTVEQWSVDLADAPGAAKRLQAWLEQQDPARWSELRLINNAGVVSKLAPLAEIDVADLSNALRVGLEAPLLLTAAFLRATAAWPARRKVLLISSGLGRRAMAGSASYCAAKAGMDHLARALALEEAGKTNAAGVVSLAPGVIDTDMQVQLRSADPSVFAERARFVALKAEGQLDSPRAAAAKVLRYLARADFGATPVDDVRNA